MTPLSSSLPYDSPLLAGRLEKSCGFAVASWEHQVVPLKLPGEVGLIKKASFMGHSAHVVPLRQQRSGTLQAQLRLIGMGRQANLLAEDTWQFKEGSAIRLVPHQRDEILAMTWKVASLEQASTFLQAKGMQGEVTANQVTIAPETTYGLVIHLVE